MTTAGESGARRRAALVAAVVFAIPMSVALGVMTGRWDVALVVGAAGGALFGVAMSVFSGRMASAEGERHLSAGAPLPDAASVRKQGPANHFMGIESVGGKLYLTSSALRFVSHALNVQTHDTTWPLAQIDRVEAIRTLGIIPNGLRIHLADGGAERFVVYGNAAWVEAIDAARADAPQPT